MPYGLIVLMACSGLVGAYVFVTDRPLWSKVLVVGLLAISLFWRHGLYLQVALGVLLSLHFTYLKSRHG